jgi:hypothetical protein
MSNPNFDNIVATTLKRYFTEDGKAVNNIFKRSAALDWIKNTAKLDAQGGATAVFPIMHKANASFQYYSGYDALTPVHGEEIVTAAEFNWKQAAIFIPMSGMEEARNSGDRAVINLLKTKVENAEMTAAEQFETALLTYSGTESSGKAWGGLPLLVGDNSSTVTTVGGIDSSASTGAYWRSYVPTTATYSLGLHSKAYNTVSYGGDACDFQVTTQLLWETYESKLQPNQRFTDAKTAESGFMNLLHRGSKVVWSDLMPATQWYFLNSRHVKLAVLSGNWMKFRGFVEPFDRDAKYGLITCYGTFGTNSRRHLGRAIWTP